MLDVKLFEAYGDVYMKTGRWDASLKTLQSQISSLKGQNIAITATMNTAGMMAGIRMINAARAQARAPLVLQIRFDRAQASAALSLFNQQLRAVKAAANSQIQIRVNLTQWRRAMRQMAFDLYRIRAFANIPITVNTSSAHANLNLLLQQLRAFQAAARSRINLGGRLSGGGGGGPGFLTGVGQGLGMPYVGSPQAAAGYLAAKATMESVKTAVQLQAKFADLQRITGMTADEMRTLKSRIFDIGTKQTGVSIEDLTGIAETGARMGVGDREGIGGLGNFVQQVAMVRNAISGIGTEELADSMARVLNVFQLGTEHIAGFGSALTQMDNISTATAQDILAITQGLSGTAATLRMTLPQILAFSSVLKDVGLTNQLAAGSFSQIFRKMASDSDNFAQKIGVDARVFKDAMRTDMMGALKMVVDKLKDLSGTDAIAAQEFLSDLGLRGVRTAGSLQQLAARFDEVAARTKIASQETGTLNALMTANQIKAQTAEAAFERFKNATVQLADALGSQLVPALTDVLNVLTVITMAMSKGKFFDFLNLLNKQHPFFGGGAADRKALEDWIGSMLGLDMGANAQFKPPGAPPAKQPALPAVPPPLPGTLPKALEKQLRDEIVANPDNIGATEEGIQQQIFTAAGDFLADMGDFGTAAEMFKKAAEIQLERAKKEEAAEILRKSVARKLAGKIAGSEFKAEGLEDEKPRNFSASIFSNHQDFARKIQQDILSGEGEIPKQQLDTQKKTLEEIKKLNQKQGLGTAVLNAGVIA
jgi:TP901 family phage tail tape measure protein